MLTRLRLKRGGGELFEVNPEIGRVFSQRRMANETPLGLEYQFFDSFMTICAMVDEMYNEFRKGKGEGTSSPKPNKGAEEPFLLHLQIKNTKEREKSLLHLLPHHHHRHHHCLLLIKLFLLKRRKRKPL